MHTYPKFFKNSLSLNVFVSKLHFGHIKTRPTYILDCMKNVILRAKNHQIFSAKQRNLFQSLPFW